MNRQLSLDVLQYNQREAQNNMDKKKMEKIKRQEEERAYLERINLELNQEKNSKHFKKQQQVDQCQKDYQDYMTTTPLTSNIKKKNSKLSEINTFKIGGDREIKAKKKYQEYNEGLMLNPTKNSAISNFNNYMNPKSVPQQTSYNIISNNNNKEFNENPMNHTSNDYKILSNNDNFDQFGRQIGIKPQEVKGQSDFKVPQVKGIENVENFSPYYDHYNYRPPSGNKLKENNIMSSYNVPSSYQGGYITDKPKVPNYTSVGNPLNTNFAPQNQQHNQNEFNQLNQNYYEKNPYENYKVGPMMDGNNSQNQHYEDKYSNQQQQYQQPPQQQHQQQHQQQQSNHNQIPLTKGKKVDLESIPIPESVTTVEEYEKYLISLNIDPYTLEMMDSGNDMSSLEKGMKNLNVNERDPEIEKIRNDYSYPKSQAPNSFNDIYGGQQNQNQYQNQDINQINQMNQLNHINQIQPEKKEYLPNYGTRPTYKNQSSILIADASAHTNQPQKQEKRDYESFTKTKPIISNPCNIFI